MITFDPIKDRLNQKKHGVSLAQAEFADWNAALTRLDDRKDYGETRFISLIPILQRLYCCIYVERDESKRVISLRKANQREYDYYAQNIN
ncbi:MAG: BrnT family toxin [Pseudomonadota bacterium]